MTEVICLIEEREKETRHSQGQCGYLFGSQVPWGCSQDRGSGSVASPLVHGGRGSLAPGSSLSLENQAARDRGKAIGSGGSGLVAVT